VAHRQTGLLIEPEDVSGLTDALSFLLAHPDRAAEMGSAGHRRVQELFSWEKCVDAYDALYRRLGGAYCG
jgi:glycosyltransferase involved in cell wall biosynthesis